MTPYRDALQAHLKEAGVETLIHYPIANHRQGAYTGLDFGATKFAAYEKLVGRILSLPVDAFITEDETRSVIDAICRFNPSLSQTS